MTTTTVEVIVQKAAISLMTNESVSDFTESFRKAASEQIGTAMVSGLTSNKKNIDMWPRAIYADSGVFSVYDPNGGPTKTVKAPYTRDAAGVFKFGKAVEVARREIFEPVGESDASTTKACGPGGTHDAMKAEWSAAFVNNLPDSAFAVILPGGKKDSEGKTVPRSLRSLPHHNASVKTGTENDTVDLPHLRNALARAPQMKAPQDVINKAIRHLQAHAKELLKTSQPAKKG